jgi:hypothetical protein
VALFPLQENLHSWMLDKLSRDQFVIKYGDEVVVLWNDGRRFRSEEAYKRTYWTESFVQWCVPLQPLKYKCIGNAQVLFGCLSLFTRRVAGRFTMQ